MTSRTLTIILLVTGFAVSMAANPHHFSFRLVGKMIVIQGKVNGQTGNFILDTGIRDLILNDAYFEGKVAAGGFQSINGQTTSGQGAFVQLHLNDLSIRQYAAVIDLTPIENQTNVPILGMIGMTVFQDYEVSIDYALREITLYKLDRKGNRLYPEPLPIPTKTIGFRYKEHIPCITAWVYGMELRLGIDTGAGTNILSLEVGEQLQEKVGDLKQKSLLGLTGKRTPTTSAIVPQMQVEQLLLPPMETVFSRLDHLNQLSGPQLDGMLGQEFLQHFRTAINFKKKEIYLWDEETTRQGPLAKGKN